MTGGHARFAHLPIFNGREVELRRNWLRENGGSVYLRLTTRPIEQMQLRLRLNCNTYYRWRLLAAQPGPIVNCCRYAARSA